MKEIISIDSIDQNYFDIVYNDILNNIDTTVSKNDRRNIIQYSSVDNKLYVKTIYLSVNTSKYNLENINTESILYRYDINEDGTIVYSGYEFNGINNDSSTVYRYDFNNNLINMYFLNNIRNRRFNTEYVRKDSNNNILKMYYYYVQFYEKEDFLNFVQENSKLLIDIDILRNVFNLIKKEDLSKNYFGFGYKGENDFSIYLFF